MRSIRTAIDAWPREIFEGGFHRVPYAGAPVVVSEPDMAAEILKEKADDFPRGEIVNRLLRPVWGRGILPAEGDDWRWQRRAGGPVFRPAAMAALVPLMRQSAEHFVTAWRQTSANDMIDLQQETRKLTLHTLFDTILSGGQDFPDRETMSRQIDAMVEGTFRFTPLDVLPLPNSWRPSSAQRGGEAAFYIRRYVGAMVARRRKEQSVAQSLRAPDLVDFLMAATDPDTGQRMDDELLRDNLIGFISAGQETSANALAWALWLVASHPPTERRLLAEIDAVVGKGPIESDHIGRLVFSKQVIQETLRLYPGAVMIARSAARTTSVGGRRVRRGEIVSIATYAMHRRPDIWRNPEIFDPDRFADDHQKDRPPFSYLPFGAGPRVCMGAPFAMMELTVSLGTLIRAVKLIPDLNRPVELGVNRLALVANGGMWVSAAPR